MLNPPGDDRRRMGRTKLTQTVRVRPSSPARGDFDDLARTLNASRTNLSTHPAIPQQTNHLQVLLDLH